MQALDRLMLPGLLGALLLTLSLATASGAEEASAKGELEVVEIPSALIRMVPGGSGDAKDEAAEDETADGSGPEQAATTPSPAAPSGGSASCLIGPDGEVLHAPSGKACRGSKTPPVATAPAKKKPSREGCMYGDEGVVLYAPPGSQCGTGPR